MRKIHRFLVVAALVLGVSAVPVTASAGEVSKRCETIEATLEGYGWHVPVCWAIPPIDDL